MANPRKFSEKIALHNQKQAEETAAFEKIMREVSVATNVKPVANGSEEVVTNPNLQQVRGRPVGYRERGRSVGSVGPMRSEKRSADKSPYSSGPYLSPPPPDTSWRRTHSDSALHHSVSQCSSTESLAHLHSPGSQRRTLIDNQQYDKKRYLSTTPDKRPRSCCDVPRVPGIHVFTTQHDPGVVQIPIGNNTGSLPDLTNFQFSPPIHAPLDQDDQYNLSSPYNSNVYTIDSCPVNGNIGDNCNSNIKMQMLGQNCITGQINGLKMSPVQTLMYQHIPLSPAQQSQQSCGAIDGQTELNSSHLNIGNSQLNSINSLGSYRNQQSNRPSPQSSPGLTIQYGSSSPLCGSPQSPSSPSNSSVSSTNQHQNYQTQKDFYSNQTQTNNLQQHFEQFNMLDSPGSTGIEYICSPTNNSYMPHTDDYVSSELLNDNGYYSTSPSQSLQYNTNQNHTTPNTPTSIPNIVFTDCSNGDVLDNQNHFEKDLNSTNTFDPDFFTTDESIRQSLVDQIDLEQLDHIEHLQMLAEPNNHEETNNDHFRM